PRASLARGGLFAGRGGLERRMARVDDVEDETVVLLVDLDLAAGLELAEEDLVGERPLDLVLDQPRHRARAEDRVVALARQPLARARRDRERDALLGELIVHFLDELVDDVENHLEAQRIEGDDRVEAVAELGAEGLLDRLLALADIGRR